MSENDVWHPDTPEMAKAGTVSTLGHQHYNDIPIPSTIWVDVTHHQKSYGIQLQSWHSFFMKSLDDHVCE